jgi:translation initiation factor IF-2
MKVHELAKKLEMTSKELLEKATSMGIEVTSANSAFSDIDAKTVENTIIANRNKETETKIVRVAPKRVDLEQDEPVVTVKAAHLNKGVGGAQKTKAQTKSEEPVITRRPPMGMPVVPKEVERRAHPVGQPVPKKAEAEQAQPVVEPVIVEEKPVAGTKKTTATKSESAAKPTAKPTAKATADVPATEKPAPVEAKPETTEKPIPEAKKPWVDPYTATRKVVIVKKNEAGKTEVVSSDGPHAKEKKEIIPEQRATERPRNTDDRPRTGTDRPRPTNDKPRTGEVWTKPATDKPRTGEVWTRPATDKPRTGEVWTRPEGQARPDTRPAPRSNDGRPDQRSGERRPDQRPPGTRPDYKPGAPGDAPARKPRIDGAPDAGKPGSATTKGKTKDKEHDKFNKLDKGKKPPVKATVFENKSLEKKTKKKYAKPKFIPEVVVETEALPVGTKIINVPITLKGFAEQIGISETRIIMALMKLGVVTNVNATLDQTTVETLAESMGINVIIGEVEIEEVKAEEGIDVKPDTEADLVPRPPIITVMGHVDHGKTSLLDAIRKTNVTSSESGGITQHIGASEVVINGKKIVFLDTPGHEAFTAMRARGADVTDIAVLVVAADDSVKPQTIESISHAKAAGVPIIVAINKMDKPGANVDKVKQDLSEHGILVEEWGGDVISVPVSAKTGDGIVNLLEMILLQAEILELRANPNRLAMGTVIEARLDKSQGPIATLLVTNGTLKAGNSVVAGTCSGRIRLMTNHLGETIRKADPATAVEVIGFTDVPAAGDTFNAVSETKMAKDIAEKRKAKQREEVMARTSSTTLEELFAQIQEGNVKDLNLIIKGDVQGSVGAVTSSLEKLTNENVRVKIVHTGVGGITESDVMLAGTSGAIIIGFNVRPSATVTQTADREGIQIRTYRVIYDIINDIESAMKGMLDPEFKEVVLGEVEIRETFKVPNLGVIGGAYVRNGKVVRNAEIRLIRDGIVIHEGKISSLKRFKDDAKEVLTGFECGIGIEKYNDIKVDDIIECFMMQEVERK